MQYDPLTAVLDAPVAVFEDTMRALAAFRAAEKFQDLPGIETREERQRLTAIFDAVLDRVIDGLQANRNKRWVMAQIQPALVEVVGEDTEGREQFGMHVERLMDMLGIESSDGMLNFYLVMGT